GIFSCSSTLLMVSGPPPVERGPLAGLPVERERASLSARVRPREYPVLPCREPAEDLGLERLRTNEAEVRLQAGQRVGAHRRALLDRQAPLLPPVEVVGREGDEAGLVGRRGVERAAVREHRAQTLGLAEEARLEP